LGGVFCQAGKRDQKKKKTEKTEGRRLDNWMGGLTRGGGNDEKRKGMRKKKENIAGVQTKADLNRKGQRNVKGARCILRGKRGGEDRVEQLGNMWLGERTSANRSGGWWSRTTKCPPEKKNKGGASNEKDVGGVFAPKKLGQRGKQGKTGGPEWVREKREQKEVEG